MLEFAFPWMAVLLPFPFLVRALLPPRTLRPGAVRVPFGDRLRRASSGGATAAVSRIPWLRWGVWILLVVSLMRPRQLMEPRQEERPTRDLMMLVDLSGSMNQEDFTSPEGGRMGRLDAVKQVAGDFLERREGDRVGLIVFGDAAFLQVPFTTDLALCRQLLEETAVGMAGPRTAFGDAIGLGLLQFEQSEAPSRTLLALTDGNDSASEVPPVEAARVARDREVVIHCIAIGDPRTVGEDPLDEATLKEVADMSGGTYFFAADREQLESVYAEIDALETREVEISTYRPRRDLYVWPLAAALLLSLPGAAFQLRSHQGAQSDRPRPRIRVNPRSGEMEVVS